MYGSHAHLYTQEFSPKCQIVYLCNPVSRGELPYKQSSSSKCYLYVF